MMLQSARSLQCQLQGRIWMQEKRDMPRKMSKSLCFCILVWRGSFCFTLNGDTVPGLFYLPAATTMVQRKSTVCTGEKSFLQPPRVDADASSGLFHTLQLVCREGLAHVRTDYALPWAALRTNSSDSN